MGEIRRGTKESSALDDAAIEKALAEAETAAQLTGYVQLMVREALVAVVQSQIARAMKDTQGAKQFFELAQMAKLLEGAPVTADPQAEMSVLERTILEGLRNALRNEPLLEAGPEPVQ